LPGGAKVCGPVGIVELENGIAPKLKPSLTNSVFILFNGGLFKFPIGNKKKFFVCLFDIL
jgi:hypothetical protein